MANKKSSPGKFISVLFGGAARREEQRAANEDFGNQMDAWEDTKMKNPYAGVKNPYADMENVYEDQTVDLKAAEFEEITITDLLNTFDEITAQKNIGTIRDQLTPIINDLVYKYNVPISRNVKHIDTVTEMAENLASIKQISNFQSSDMFGMAPNMMRRRLRIPTAELLPYIETNMSNLLRLYHRRMSPSIAMAKKYGDASMLNHKKTLHKEMQEQIF